MNNEKSIVQIAIARRQFERQMLHVRRTKNNGCSCATKPGRKGERRDDYRTDKSCDLCGPFVASFNLARTKLDQLIDNTLLDVGFSPEAKVDEHVKKYMAECSGPNPMSEEMFANV